MNSTVDSWVQQIGGFGRYAVKRPLFALGLAFGIVFSVAGTGSAQEQGRVSKEQLAEQLPGIEASDISESAIPGMYEIAVGSNVAYVTSDGRYLLQGDLYDLSTRANLTEERRSRARVSMLAGVDSDSMIIFSPKDGEVKHTITMFTDIDCGYCRQFHSGIDRVNALGIEVRYLFYPRTGPDTESWAKADKVWCAENRSEAFTVAQLGGPVPEEICEGTPVNGHWDLGHLVGVRGTPAIYNETGAQVGGYLPPDTLLERLEALSQ